MECSSLLTQKLHFIIFIVSGSYAIESISEQSMWFKRQFLGQKRGISDIIERWYLFFFFKSSIATVEIWAVACWGSEQRERRWEDRRSNYPVYLCQTMFVLNFMWCANIPLLDIFASFLLGGDLVWEIRQFEIFFKVIYSQSQESNPDLAIVSPSSFSDSVSRSRVPPVRVQNPSIQLKESHPLFHRVYCDFHEKYKKNINLPNSLYKISFFYTTVIFELLLTSQEIFSKMENTQKCHGMSKEVAIYLFIIINKKLLL